MEYTEKAEQTPENAQKGHVVKIRKKYDVLALCLALGIHEEAVFYASKKLPKGWKRTEIFSKPYQENILVNQILSLVRDKKISQPDLYKYYKATVEKTGIGSRQECLFIRHARNYFKKR